MNTLSLKSDIFIGDEKIISVAYNLIHCSGLYGIECFVQGADDKSISTYAMQPQISGNYEFMAGFIYKLAQDQVMPIHLENIVGDIFNC